MRFDRACGVLLHPTSLPGRFGIGELGNEAYQFIDFLSQSNQKIWQILPLGPTGFGDSPYQCFSAFAGNHLLISLEDLLDPGLVSDEDLTSADFPEERVDYGRVIEFKNRVLRRAFERFSSGNMPDMKDEFEFFCNESSRWLDDYALFRALKDAHNGAPWNKWERSLAHRDRDALEGAKQKLRKQIEEQKFLQFLFNRQWYALKAYCEERNIKIIGDIPIFVAYDSADVWKDPQLFKLRDDLTPSVVAGVPPDYFSRTGQLWGNPIYNWDRMRESGFQWWIERVRSTLESVDIIRLDHFRGFAGCWEIPGGNETAEHGEWVNSPGEEIFSAIRHELGELPLIAEDLGVITPDVEKLRDDFAFPGMRVLQFAFTSDNSNEHLPHNFVPNLVVYTATHDNDTTVGWYNYEKEGSDWNSSALERERTYCNRYLNSNGHEIHWDLIRCAYSSVADLAIIPLQDILGLGTQARMNHPSTATNNWGWRYRKDALTPQISERLKSLAELFGR